MKRFMDQYFPSEEGQGMTEYALIMVLLVLVVAAALGPLGEAVKIFFVGLAADVWNMV